VLSPWFFESANVQTKNNRVFGAPQNQELSIAISGNMEKRSGKKAVSSLFMNG